MVETVARHPFFHFAVERFFDRDRGDFLGTGAKHHALPLLYIDLEKAGYQQVFLVFVASFHLHLVLDVVVPVGYMGVFRGFGELHIKVRIAGIELHPDAVGHFFVFCIGVDIGFAEAVRIAECQEGPQAESCRRVGVDECPADEVSVGIGSEQHFPFQDDSADLVDIVGYRCGGEVGQVAMAVRMVHPAGVFMDTQVKLGAVLNNRLVEV